jgi:tRNA-Thr(GGU) m(6)t(6)A37 methyltransferase TsaA
VENEYHVDDGRDDATGGQIVGDAGEGVRYAPIGVIRSPFADTTGMPVQSVAAGGVDGSVEVFPEYGEGLKDMDGFSHVILLYHMHRIADSSLTVRPFLDKERRGVFATRSPKRPNPIGVSVVRLIAIEGCTLRIEDVDVVDGTPLLDIKPYVPAFDDRAGARIGWFEGKAERVHEVRADDRFGRGGEGAASDREP